VLIHVETATASVLHVAHFSNAAVNSVFKMNPLIAIFLSVLDSTRAKQVIA
jgi:hypothetical protein